MSAEMVRVAEPVDAAQVTRALGRRIRVLRAERGWSQETLATLAGIHRTYLGSVERGRVQISIVQLVKIARAFELQPSALIDTSFNRSSLSLTKQTSLGT